MRRRLVRILLILGTFFVALNVVAFFHAWRMTHFLPSGSKTNSPEQLSALGKLEALARGVDIPKPGIGPVRASFAPHTRTVHFVTRDGLKLEAWDIAADAERGVVVMFHGYAVSRSALLGSAQILHELGWRTVLVDHRGSGGSDGRVTTLGWHEAADVAAAVNWTRREWPSERLVVFGQSMGAVAALRAIAVENVRPDGLIVECPFDTLLHTVEHRYQVMGLPGFPFAELLVFWGGAQHGFNAFALNPVEYARSVTCPALVMDGENDPWVWPQEARRVASAMSGPTQSRIFKDAGHSGYWRSASEEYQRTLSEWLNQRTGSGK